MEIDGTLHRVGPIEIYGLNFQNRFFYLKHIDSAGKNQFLKFKLSFGKVELVDSFELGDRIKVFFNLEGNEAKNDKGEPVVYDRKEVYKIEGFKEIKKEKHEDESKFYELKDGEKDVDLSF